MSRFLEDMEAAVPALRRYARALTRSTDQADDLVQDCLERAIRKQRLFRPSGPLRPWLFTLLLNIHRNQIRADRRRPTGPSLEEVAAPATPPGQPGHIDLAELAAAIDRLPLDQREALLLVTLEGLAYAEAAAILGIPPGTLMSRLARARATLRLMTEAPSEPRLRTVK